ncbi:hypothetical protein DPX16_2556 [Anabarilius grahami]|uniref:Immunoglobulin domain-containing protein n=1 Tax=Anabarilius grahami TaxID=495550 RepID=A0A3N0XGS0_ANAGA|nr:hypothetical protein DPX16_2556 [Anabarilius grahami]
MEGDSVTLDSGLTEMKDDDQIQWRFGTEGTLIAEIKRFNRFTVYDDDLDGRFRDRLKMDNQTGSLTITDITTEHTGEYRVNTVEHYFSITVYVEISVMEGDSVTLKTGLTKMKDVDQIQWRFGNERTVIAELKKQSNRINDDVIDDDVLDGVDDLYDDVLDGEDNLYDVVLDGDVLDGDDNLYDDVLDGDDDLHDVVLDGDDNLDDDVLDGRFRDRLKLDNQTGSLTITNITTEHAGVYNVYNNHVNIHFVLALYVEISVMEGDSVTLNSSLTGMEYDHQIQWRFGTECTLIAEINKRFNRITDDVLDGRFRDRLKLDNQTGSLTITDITTEHAGDYKLQNANWKISLKAFRVSVSDSVHCCGRTEAVIRLVLSALVGVATVIILVYDIRSRRAERDRAQIHTSEI